MIGTAAPDERQDAAREAVDLAVIEMLSNGFTTQEVAGALAHRLMELEKVIQRGAQAGSRAPD